MLPSSTIALFSAYLSENNHTYIFSTDKDNIELKKASLKIRRLFQNNEIVVGDDFHTLMLSLKFDFNAYGKQWNKWEMNFLKLKGIAEKDGDANISQLVRRIGPWLYSQRTSYRIGYLSELKILLLESIGVDWNPSEKRDVNWQSYFDEVSALISKNPNVFKTDKEEMDSKTLFLSRWFSNQKSLLKRGLLTSERACCIKNIVGTNSKN